MVSAIFKIFTAKASGCWVGAFYLAIVKVFLRDNSLILLIDYVILIVSGFIVLHTLSR